MQIKQFSSELIFGKLYIIKHRINYVLKKGFRLYFCSLNVLYLVAKRWRIKIIVFKMVTKSYASELAKVLFLYSMRNLAFCHVVIPGKYLLHK